MRIMLTGASGYLGRALWGRLAQEHEVTALGFAQAGPDVRSVDIRDAAAFADVVRRGAPELVIHCAAYRDPDACERDPVETRRLNVQPVQTLVDVLPAAASVLLISSDYVFDGSRPPYREGDARRPVNVYGQSKLEGEDVVLARDSSLVLRMPLLIGPGPSFASSGLIAKLAQMLLDGTPREVDDEGVRFPTDIRDVAEAAAFLLAQRATGVFQYSSSVGRTQYAWACRLADHMGLDAGVFVPVAEPQGRAARRPHDCRLDTGRIRALGFSRETPFETVADQVLALRASAAPDSAGGGSGAGRVRCR
jgi:dTDP-4-dehydrorhamnose reductase